MNVYNKIVFLPEIFRLFPLFGIHIGRGGCFSWIEANWGYLEKRAPRSCYHHKRRFNADEILPSRLLFACNRFSLTSSQLRECKQNNIEINRCINSVSLITFRNPTKKTQKIQLKLIKAYQRVGLGWQMTPIRSTNSIDNFQKSVKIRLKLKINWKSSKSTKQLNLI